MLSAAFGADAAIDRLGRRLRWTKPVGWVPAIGGVAVSLLFSQALLPAFGQGSRTTADYYDELGRRMAAIDQTPGRDGRSGHQQLPDLDSEAYRIPALALPDEPPTDVLRPGQSNSRRRDCWS